MLTRAAKQRRKRADDRSVGKIPRPDRLWSVKRRACRGSLEQFCLTFLPVKFFLPFSADHHKAIATLERVVRSGGQFALAMPRANGKTELCKAAALWSVLYGYRRFVVIIGATAKHAERIIDDLKATIESNDELHAAFPEATHCVRSLEGIVHRARVQSFSDGTPTGLRWTAGVIQLARVKNANCSGATIQTASLTGAIRGMTSTGPNGETVRPDLVLLDDPQDRESATSQQQIEDRQAIIRGDVLGLAGKTKTIAVMMPCTVIARGDLAERFLDRKKNPQWNGERTRRVETFPTNTALWEQYFDLRSNELSALGTCKESSQFYRDNRAAMDAGAVLSWPEAYDRDKFTSAIEEAMVARHENPKEFAAEHQNDPEPEDLLTEAKQLEESDLVRKLNQLDRGTVPRECNRLTAFVDVQAECLFWAVCGWTDKFGGALVDYGVYPQQPRAVFDMDNLPVKLSDRFPKLERGARIYSALAELVPALVGRAYKQDGADGALTVSLGLIDAGFETETVHDFISRSPLRAVLRPSMGRGFKADSKPMRLYSRNPGDQVGHNWRIDAKVAGKGRYVMFDANGWKTYVAESILAPSGASGSFYLPGRMLADAPLLTIHLLSEYRIPTAGPWGRVEVWKLRPDRRENHWWDATVGCAVAASVSGLVFSSAVAAGAGPEPPKPPRKKIRGSELFAQKNGTGGWIR